MDIVDEIKKCKTDEELKALAEEAIEIFTKQAKQDNLCTCFLGDNISYNPTFISGDPNYYEANNTWFGYIPKGMKVTYGRIKEKGCKSFTNMGCYYYLDDDSYIYDFFKFIKEEDIEDDFDIIFAVFKFLNKRFSKFFEPTERKQLHKLIYKDDQYYFPPVREHSIKDFYYNGSAKCTEYAVMAQNLMSSLNLETILINDFNHAYNIYIPGNNENKVKDAYIVDFSQWVPCYNLKFDYVGRAPFIGNMNNCNKELITVLIEGSIRGEFDDYYLFKINGSIYEIRSVRNRDYGVDYEEYEEKKTLIKERKRNCTM